MSSKERPPPIKKQSSFEALTAKFSKKSSNSKLPSSPTNAAKRPDAPPTTPKKPPTTLNRQSLKDFLSDQQDNPSLEGIVRLGNMCFEGIEGHGLHPRAPEMCLPVALLLEYANQKNPQLLTPPEHKKLGFSHYHAWCNGGIVAESQHLVYARSAYEVALQNPQIADDSSTWLAYSKLLMHLGEAELGVKTITTMLRKFHNDGNSSLYHLTAGAMLSSLGKYEQAGHYFFETIQLGLPKFFTKSDLMFILSRSFEQLGYETKTDANDPVEDGYVMVFTHMLSETGGSGEGGEGDTTSRSTKDLLYDEWIGSFETWRNIGDKCAMHGLFNLAADFYGQGLVRDHTAFSRASLWFRFAKSCFRCARTSDAQLAVKQAVTLDPNNSQCNVALNTWSKYTNTLTGMIEDGPVGYLLDLVPEERTLDQVAALKIQALYRGERSRVLFNTKLTEASSSALFERLQASLNLTIKGHAKTTRAYNFMVKVHWKGSIRHVDFINKDSEVNGRLVFQTPFKLPLYFVKPENSYDLVLEHIGLSKLAQDEASDLPLQYYKPIEHEVQLSLIEKETGIYHKRIFHVALSDKNELLLLEHSTVILNNIPQPEPEPEPEPEKKQIAQSKLQTKKSSQKLIAEPKQDTKELPVSPPKPTTNENTTKAFAHNDTPSVTSSVGSTVTPPFQPKAIADDHSQSSASTTLSQKKEKEKPTATPPEVKPKAMTSTTPTASVSSGKSAKQQSNSVTSSHLADETDNDTASVTHASIVNDSVSGVSWNDHDESSTVAESIHSLFKPYRSRKGCYTFYGNSFLYNACIVSALIPSVTAGGVPSAIAMNKGNGAENKNTKGYLQVKILNSRTENRYMFLLPLNLTALESIHDIIPMLLLVMDEVSTSELDIARAASLANTPSSSIELNLEEIIGALTPRRHGLKVFGGKLQLLAEISSGMCGEIIIALNEQSNILKIKQQQQQQQQKDKENASNVLHIYSKKTAAWQFLQDQVYFAFDCDNGSSSYLDQSLESSTDAGQGLVGASSSGVLGGGGSGLVDKSMYSKESFVNDLERSLHNKHRHNIDGDSDDNVSVLTFTDEYEEARKKAAELEAKARAKAEAEAASLAEAQAEAERAALQQQEEEGQQQSQKSSAPEEDLEAEEARLLAEELARLQAENMAKLKAAQLAAQQAAEEEARRRQEEEEANEEARRLEEEAIFAALHPEMGLNTVIDISENDLVSIDVLPDNELDEELEVRTYLSVEQNEELDESQLAMERVEDDNNIQAAFFLAFQVQRLETLEFLKLRGASAKTKWIRRDAFECLQKRAELALANPTPPRRRGRSNSEPSMEEQEEGGESGSEVRSTLRQGSGQDFADLEHFVVLTADGVAPLSPQTLPHSSSQSYTQPQTQGGDPKSRAQSQPQIHFKLPDGTGDDDFSAISVEDDPGGNDSDGSAQSMKSSKSSRLSMRLSKTSSQHKLLTPKASFASSAPSTSGDQQQAYSFNNQNKQSGSADGSLSRSGSFVLSPSSSVELQKEEIWKAQMEAKLEILLEDQLTNEDFTANPSDLVKVLHEFSVDYKEGEEKEKAAAVKKKKIDSSSLAASNDDFFADEYKSSNNLSHSHTNSTADKDILVNNSTSTTAPPSPPRPMPVKENSPTRLPEIVSKPPIQPVSRPLPKSRAAVATPVNRRGSIIVNIPPEKMEAWENSIAHLTLSNKLSAVGKGHPNPVFFLDQSTKDSEQRQNSAASHRDHTTDTDEMTPRPRVSTAGSTPVVEDEYPLETMFNDSILTYHRRGYSTGTCAYLSIWKTKIRKCVRSYESLNSLNKAIISLRKAYTEETSKAGALCALAHTHGSVGEALGQLLDKSFKQEVLLVCQALPVHEVILRIEKSIKKDKKSNEFATETIEYDIATNEKIIFRPDSFPVAEDSPYLMDMHSPHPTMVARNSPHYGLTATDASVRIRSAKMPVLTTPQQQRQAQRLGTSDESLKLDTVTGFPLINSSPIPSPMPPLKKTKSKKKKSKTKKDPTIQGSRSHDSSGGGGGGRYIRLNDAVDIMADETSNFTVMSALEATRAKEEHLLLKYHPQDNSYYRTSKQKKIMQHKQMKKDQWNKTNQTDQTSYGANKSNEQRMEKLSIDVS